jgi:hypothetical protein
LIESGSAKKARYSIEGVSTASSGAGMRSRYRGGRSADVQIVIRVA